MNFKNFDDIGDSEPRAWSQSIGTKFGKDDEDEDEIPVPYCDESDEESSSEEDLEDEVTETETETETESVGSTKKKYISKRTRQTATAAVYIVLQEELDFMTE
jgi:hypothetical protein